MSEVKKAATNKSPVKDKKPEDRQKKPEGQKNDKGPQEKGQQIKEERKFEERKPGQGYKGRPKLYYKDRIEVTLDTVIPDLPKKDQKLSMPDDEHNQKELDKIAKQIDELYKKMNDVAREAYNKDYQPSDKGYYDLIGLLKIKQEERSKAYEEFQAANSEKDQYKGQLEEYYTKTNEYRFKMKIAGRKTDLEAQLKALKLKQSSGTISLQEEKQVIKDIHDIERSLPFAGPLEELDDQFKEIKDSLKKLKSDVSAKYEIYARLKEECRDIQVKIDEMNEDWEKKKNETTPAIQKLKEDYKSKIDALKEKKKELNKNQRIAWDKFNEQQQEIDKIKKMQKIKAGLLRAEERKKKQEEWEKRQKERQEENRETPYVQEVELCDQLIQYCNRLLPSKDDGSQGVQEKDKHEAAKNALQTDEWKKEKGTVIKGKREEDNEFFIGTNKKSKNANKPQQQKKEEVPSVQSLNHQFETINFFDALKVTPPLFTDKLEDTIKVLNDKKAYFVKLQDEAAKEDQTKKPEEATTETVINLKSY
jgi:DNA repair exonuclease SbcCD ATPase subunit